MIRPRDKGDVPDDPLSRMRHSASHVMADAVKRLRPDAKVAIGPADRDRLLLRLRHRAVHRRGRCERSRREMRKIIAANLPLRAHEVVARRGAGAVRLRGETYKVEIIESIPEGERSRSTSTASSSTSAAARTSSAPATSRRSSCCRSRAPTGAATSATALLQRIYGTAFPVADGARRATWSGSKRPSAATTAARQGARPVLDRRPVARASSLWHPEGRLRPLP